MGQVAGGLVCHCGSFGADGRLCGPAGGLAAAVHLNLIDPDDLHEAVVRTVVLPTIMAAPFMSGEDDAGGAIDLTTFGIINLDDVSRSEEFTADPAGLAVDDIAAVASDIERCANGAEVRDKSIGLAIPHYRADTV